MLQHLVDALTAQHPMPEPVAELCSRLSLPEWTAVAYIRLLLDIYNHGEGEGLLFYGNVILPFVDRFPQDTELYRIMTTKLSEVVEAKEA